MKGLAKEIAAFGQLKEIAVDACQEMGRQVWWASVKRALELTNDQFTINMIVLAGTYVLLEVMEKFKSLEDIENDK